MQPPERGLTMWQAPAGRKERRHSNDTIAPPGLCGLGIATGGGASLAPGYVLSAPFGAEDLA